MPLDLLDTATQVNAMAGHIRDREGDRLDRVERAVDAAQNFEADRYAAAISAEADRGGRTLDLTADPAVTLPAPSTPPSDLVVAAVDGSHIDVDRHLAARCFVINIGVCSLRYGGSPHADLHSTPTLYARDEELVIMDDSGDGSERIEGTVLGAIRHVAELRALADLAGELPTDVPSVLLADGILYPAGLAVFRRFVQRNIADGVADAMDGLRTASESRQLAVAAYTSMPGHHEVVEALRVGVCPDLSGETSIATDSRCAGCIEGVLDRDLFWRLLGEGERSAIFARVDPSPGDPGRVPDPAFFYLRTGTEIARVEMPDWTASDPALVDLVHAVALDQCRRGSGYPTVLIEAHEQAVVNGRDRRSFVAMVESALAGRGIVPRTSEKNLSKTIRRI